MLRYCTCEWIEDIIQYKIIYNSSTGIVCRRRWWLCWRWGRRMGWRKMVHFVYTYSASSAWIWFGCVLRFGVEQICWVGHLDRLQNIRLHELYRRLYYYPDSCLTHIQIEILLCTYMGRTHFQFDALRYSKFKLKECRAGVPFFFLKLFDFSAHFILRQKKLIILDMYLVPYIPRLARLYKCKYTLHMCNIWYMLMTIFVYCGLAVAHAIPLSLPHSRFLTLRLCILVIKKNSYHTAESIFKNE